MFALLMAILPGFRPLNAAILDVSCCYEASTYSQYALLVLIQVVWMFQYMGDA